MATSSSKKIQRVQRAGVTKRAGDRPPLGFPIAIIAILILGTVGVYFARDARISSDEDAPVVNQDEWHAAFGIYKCDQYLPNLGASLEDNDGIFSTGDGLIHVHPNTEETAGLNAQFGFFLNNVGITASDGSIAFVDGTTMADGDTCGSGDEATQDTKVKLFVWPPQASTDSEPEILSTGIATAPFRQDGQIMALALVPADVTNIDLPPTIDQGDPEETYGDPIEGLEEKLAEQSETEGSEPGTESDAATTSTAPVDSETTTTAANG